MPTFRFRDADVELFLPDIDNMEIDDAEVIEEEIGLDLRDFLTVGKMRQAKITVLLSARRVFRDATLQEAGRVKLRPVIEAIAAANAVLAPAPEREPQVVEVTGAMSIPLAATGGVGDGGEVLSPTSAGSEDSTLLPA